MNPKAEKFFDAITLLPEDIVEEAQEYRFRRRPAVWKKVGGLAACLVLIASISLLVLPMRGCGGSGGSSDSMNSSGAPPMQSTDSCAPADGAASGDPMPEPEESPESVLGGSYGEAGQVSFTAMVVEIQDASILVEPMEGENERNSSDRIVVNTKDLELPELAVGDRVRITYDGQIQESYPAGITGATAIERMEEE